MPELLVVVDALYLHPVKACAGVATGRLVFDADGLLAGDREWVVVDEGSTVVWQGSHPRLARVHPRLDGGVLTLHAADGAAAGPFDGASGRPCTLRVWNDVAKREDVHEGIDEGDVAAAFLAAVTGAPLRLVRLGRDARRREGVNAVHLVSRESLDEFDDELARGTRLRADVARLRPNVVVRGLDEPLLPFLEERFTALRGREGVSACALAVTSPCVRCVVPNVDPATGEVDEGPLDALVRLSAQRDPAGPVCFGVYAAGEAGADLRVGDVLSASLDF